MSDESEVTGHPQGGLDESSDGGSPPGTYGDGQTVSPPGADQRAGDQGSRAATDGQMTSDASAPEAPGTGGVDQQVGGPTSEDPRDPAAPGGSAGNRSGRAPDQG